MSLVVRTADKGASDDVGVGLGRSELGAGAVARAAGGAAVVRALRRVLAVAYHKAAPGVTQHVPHLSPKMSGEDRPSVRPVHCKRLL